MEFFGGPMACRTCVTFNLNSEMKTTEYSEHTESKEVVSMDTHTQKMRATKFITISSSVYSVYSVVHHLPF
jgi:hypothetical protein